MGTLPTSPRKQQIHLREASSAKGKPGREAVHPIVRPEISAPQRNRALIGRERETQWQMPDGMLKKLANQHDVRRAETVILGAAAGRLSVDVRSAERGLEVKRDFISSRRHGQRGKKT